MNQNGVCVSLEEWAARIFKPNSAGIVHDAKLECKKTKQWFERSKKLTGVFSFSGTDLSKNVKGVHNKKDGVQNCADVETSFESSPDRHKGQPRQKLLYNISCGIKLLLNKSEENNNTKKKKMKKGEQDDKTIAQEAASSLLALVNTLDESNNFNQLDKMQMHMSNFITEQEGKEEATKKKDSEIIRRLKARGGHDKSSSSSSSEDDTFANETMTTPTDLRKQKKI